ncbi:MAG: glycosyltransferase, partial [Candidatus Taylorbacteria bacterium]|nr:glycosyltransferase [Candidatus Taylorbacteria bacterium]
IQSREILSMLKIIRRFNYRFAAPSEGKLYKIIVNTRLFRKIKKILKLPAPKDRLLTDKDVSHLKKLELISQSKITIVHNLLSFNVQAAWRIQNTPDFKSNRAFDLVPPKNIWRTIWHFFLRKEYIVPQQKTRLLEAAFCRSLILCRRDPFNIIERFFTPDKDFVYYEDGRLEEKLKEILANFDRYEIIIESAYQKALKEYTTYAFFQKYLKNLN